MSRAKNVDVGVRLIRQHCWIGYRRDLPVRDHGSVAANAMPTSRDLVRALARSRRSLSDKHRSAASPLRIPYARERSFLMLAPASRYAPFQCRHGMSIPSRGATLHPVRLARLLLPMRQSVPYRSGTVGAASHCCLATPQDTDVHPLEGAGGFFLSRGPALFFRPRSSRTHKGNS